MSIAATHRAQDRGRPPMSPPRALPRVAPSRLTSVPPCTRYRWRGLARRSFCAVHQSRPSRSRTRRPRPRRARMQTSMSANNRQRHPLRAPATGPSARTFQCAAPRWTVPIRGEPPTHASRPVPSPTRRAQKGSSRPRSTRPRRSRRTCRSCSVLRRHARPTPSRRRRYPSAQRRWRTQRNLTRDAMKLFSRRRLLARRRLARRN